MDKNKTLCRITIAMHKDLKQKIRIEAAKTEKNTSEWIRDVVEQKLKEKVIV